jgi:hypothetical protein
MKRSRVRRSRVRRSLHSERYNTGIKQTGKSDLKSDRKRSAKPVGWRKSDNTKKWYWESRRNRSDRSKRLKL